MTANPTTFKKGRQKTGGKKKGTPNRKTILKQQRLRAATAKIENLVNEVGITPDQAAKIVEKEIVTRKLGKDILSEFANSLAGMAAFHQPHADNPTHGSDEKFRAYAMMAIAAAKEAAQFETPRLAAVMVGQTQTKRIAVTGGLPAPSLPPPELPPDMYDDHDVKPNGHAERRPDDSVADLPSGASPVLSGNERR